MSVQTAYQSWKANTSGQVGDGQCVSLIVNNSRAYVEALWPGVSWTNIIAPVVGAKSLLNAANPAYFDVVQNNHSDPNQVPPVGAIMVFDETPHSGATNTFTNPYGHTGINDRAADGSGFYLTQQNAPSTGQGVNTTHYPWNFRYCLGWLVPKLSPDPTPTPPPVVTAEHTIYLPPTTGPWHLYPEGGPYTYAAAGNHILVPANYGGLTYNIVADRGNGIYTIQSEMFGRGDLYTRGSDVIIK